MDQINNRSHDDLSNTKGIGIVRGQAVIDHRTKQGPLSSLADLASVKGFGKGFFRKLLQTDCVLPVLRKNKLSNLLSAKDKEV